MTRYLIGFLAGVLLSATSTAQPFSLPNLPYDAGALEPHIDRATMEVHHGGHHRSYVDKLNELAGQPLGGKSPVVVMPDVDVAETAPGVAGAIFFNSGQVCVAGSRLYAHKSVFDKVVEGMAETANFWAPRPSLDPEAHMGPLVSKEQHERVLGYIEAGKRDGASVLMGGDVPSNEGGYYVNPTILTDVNPQMSVVREEIFGPVVVAQRFEDLDEVVKEANDTQYGLAAGVWTKDASAAVRIASKLQAGTVWVNCHAMIDPALPFGGYKESGVGHEQGRLGLEAYLETKSVLMKL